MKKEITLLGLLVLSFTSFGQETFSKLIDLNVAKRNIVRDFEMQDDKIYILAEHFCASTTNPSSYSSCTSLSKYSNKGELLQSILIDTLYPEGSNKLTFFNNTLYVSGHWHGALNGRPTALMEFDTDLSPLNSLSYESTVDWASNNEGIIQSNHSFYLYGSTLDSNTGKRYGQIMSLDNELHPRWAKKYGYGERKNNCLDLQYTTDEHLIFLNPYHDGPGLSGSSGFQILKLDQNGLVVDSFEFEDIAAENPAILASDDGSIYFTSQDHPLGNALPSNGRINKLSADFSNILWSFQLPTDPFSNARRYKIYDYLQTQDGNIIACGDVWDETEDGPAGGIHRTWNGFLVSMNPDGERNWLRIFKYENEQENLPTEQYGNYRHSHLRKVKEDDDGNIIACGTVSYTNTQQSILNDSVNTTNIWLLSVTPEGCIENNNCEEITIVKEGQLEDRKAAFKIGTTWTYEVEDPLSRAVSFQTYTIIDSAVIMNEKVHVISNSYDANLEYMLVKEDSVLFYDERLEAFQLNYKFYEDIDYSVAWKGVCHDSEMEIADVTIDSITKMPVENDSIEVQNVRLSNNGSVNSDINTSILKNIGLMYGGLRLPLGLALCDSRRQITKVRCFESDNYEYNFNNYPCDSTWFTTSIEPIAPPKLELFPNPSTGLLTLRGIDHDVHFQVFNALGQLIGEDKSVNHTITISSPGFYYLSFQYSDKIFTQKVIISE
ncbi:MAG: T9SS type A sorting domain-containing protein [Bacteroidota bacterium]